MDAILKPKVASRILLTVMAKKDAGPRIVNRRAYHDYDILEKLEVGMALTGSEVKSIRNSQVSLAEGFASIDSHTMQLMLYNVDIAPYPHADPATTPHRKRHRKLLAHKRQIAKLMGHTTAKGITIVPLAIYFIRGMAKLEIGVARGKKSVDKRQSIKDREASVQIRRGMTRKRL